MKGFCGECDSRYACDIDPDKCDEWPDPVPMTNADRIRAMSDEELARFFIGDSPNYWHPGLCLDGETCIGCFLNWLQQPEEEG